jgi:hypothetical protein
MRYFIPQKFYQVLGGSLARALGVVALENLLFLALMVTAPGNRNMIADRIRTAFETGELVLKDFLLFDMRRGFMQYNDCAVLQMLFNERSSLLESALAPTLYKDWGDQCALLRSLVVEQVDPEPIPVFRYTRYWHGYNALTGFTLRGMELRDLRRVLSGAVWCAIGMLALMTWRSGPRARRTGLMIACTAASVWAVPYFAPGLTYGPGDALLLLILAGLVAWPSLAQHLSVMVPYAAGFGAAVVFFEMLTGQLPIAGAWLTALTLAAGRDQGQPEGLSAPMMALAAMTAFSFGAAATVLVKQVLAGMLVEPKTGVQFFGSLRYYMEIPEAQGGWPGIVLPFVQLVRWSYMLTFGNHLAGYGLIIVMALTWCAAAIRAWQERQNEHGRDVLILISIALVPVVWVLLLPRHTYMHPDMMVRILVVPISLAPLALCWPPARGEAIQINR